MPVLAWKPELKTSAASVPFSSAILLSSSSCKAMLPEIRREAPEPQP